ncbi:DEAD/DEAH box helicase family protein [Desertibacillus haloalkaliphilus]|uniref:DEAD/DEAH box helicase family protein n=1 Tax=Desertibacillus haloalkaliphilus TaxID=1328930 RepID=UPI001C264076|nr:DEAD/DEAH box helicase family protein [Desertibacillus haloalkaliphilus]MBU8908998.1 hypothetical protein [Desertibacillus haloalkaliphilus]
MEIKVIDAICGAGKTSYAIQTINDHSQVGFGTDGDIFTSDKKFIYVTPYLAEVERVLNSTKAEFAEPYSKRGSKYEHAKKLIEDGKSIVMTHKLFSMLDNETLDSIESEGYVLFMDEVANVLEQIRISQQDIQVLIKSRQIEIDVDGQVHWIAEEYESVEDNRFRDIRVLAENENLFIYNNIAMFWTMNIRAFLAFDEVYILTYLFDGQIQKYYYDLYDVQYEKYSVVQKNGRYELVDYNSLIEPRGEIGDLLTIYEDYQSSTGRKSNLNTNFLQNPLKNKIDDSRTALSKSWFDKAHKTQIEQLRKNLINFFRNRCITEPSNQKLFWTTLKSYAPKLKNKKCTLNKKDDRSRDNYVPLNMRATNAYSECTAMAYVYNRFMNPMENRFFNSRGIKVDVDQLAMSDLIQFLFRGCIRNGQPMDCYIPSERMRELLMQWVDFAEGNDEYVVGE